MKLNAHLLLPTIKVNNIFRKENGMGDFGRTFSITLEGETLNYRFLESKRENMVLQVNYPKIEGEKTAKIHELHKDFQAEYEKDSEKTVEYAEWYNKNLDKNVVLLSKEAAKELEIKYKDTIEHGGAKAAKILGEYYILHANDIYDLLEKKNEKRLMPHKGVYFPFKTWRQKLVNKITLGQEVTAKLLDIPERALVPNVLSSMKRDFGNLEAFGGINLRKLVNIGRDKIKTLENALKNKDEPYVYIQEYLELLKLQDKIELKKYKDRSRYLYEKPPYTFTMELNKFFDMVNQLYSNYYNPLDESKFKKGTKGKYEKAALLALKQTKNSKKIEIADFYVAWKEKNYSYISKERHRFSKSFIERLEGRINAKGMFLSLLDGYPSNAHIHKDKDLDRYDVEKKGTKKKPIGGIMQPGTLAITIYAPKLRAYRELRHQIFKKNKIPEMNKILESSITGWFADGKGRIWRLKLEILDKKGIARFICGVPIPSFRWEKFWNSGDPLLTRSEIMKKNYSDIIFY